MTSQSQTEENVTEAYSVREHVVRNVKNNRRNNKKTAQYGTSTRRGTDIEKAGFEEEVHADELNNEHVEFVDAEVVDEEQERKQREEQAIDAMQSAKNAQFAQKANKQQIHEDVNRNMRTTGQATAIEHRAWVAKNADGVNAGKKAPGGRGNTGGGRGM